MVIIRGPQKWVSGISIVFHMVLILSTWTRAMSYSFLPSSEGTSTYSTVWQPNSQMKKANPFSKISPENHTNYRVLYLLQTQGNCSQDIYISLQVRASCLSSCRLRLTEVRPGHSPALFATDSWLQIIISTCTRLWTQISGLSAFSQALFSICNN